MTILVVLILEGEGMMAVCISKLPSIGMWVEVCYNRGKRKKRNVEFVFTTALHIHIRLRKYFCCGAWRNFWRSNKLKVRKPELDGKITIQSIVTIHYCSIQLLLDISTVNNRNWWWNGCSFPHHDCSHNLDLYCKSKNL